jgi:hypothetical protein
MSRLTSSSWLGVVLVLAVGCSSSSKPPAGAACVLNSDCNNPLSCIFGKCHNVCVTTADCPAGQRCVKGTTGNACQLDGEKLCSAAMTASTCVAPLLCAIDLQCRNTCTTAADCTGGQSCASGSCAEKTEVNVDGTLKVGTTPADGGVADGPMMSSDSGPTGAVGPCGVPEMEPNDDRDHATPIAAPAMFTSCIGTDKDNDYYELTAPNDPAGGYYQFSVTNVVFETDVQVFNVSDNGMIGEIETDSDGQDLYWYLAVAPGKKYRVVVSPFGSTQMAPTKYNFNVTYTKVDDSMEPNDTSDGAKPLALNTPVMGYLFEGVKAVPVKPELAADWYAVTVAAGNLNIAVENVPSNVEAEVQIIDPTGKMDEEVGSTAGANLTKMLMGVTPGVYKISVQPFVQPERNPFGRAMDASDLPPNFTHQYKLTVTQ